MQDFGSVTKEVAMLHKGSLHNKLILSDNARKKQSEGDDILQRKHEYNR